MIRLILVLFTISLCFSEVFSEVDNSLSEYNNEGVYRPYYDQYAKHHRNRTQQYNNYDKPIRFGNLVDGDENGSNRGTNYNDNSVASNDAHSDWTYKDQDDWRRVSATCGGDSQSPIDITPEIKKSYLSLDFQVNSRGEKPIVLKNTGHTAELSFEGDSGSGISARGSALNYDSYIFQQMHFHWGAYDNEGSEHALFGQKYSAEVHFVFYNGKYRSFGDAASNKDGLTVFGMFLQASNQDNYNLEPIFANLDKIRQANSKTTINMDITSLLPRYKDRYFRYSGSLTTPPCSEVVNWIVFETPIKIGRRQLEKFRQLEDSNGNKLKTTWRVLQSRNRRLLESSKLR